MNGHPSRDGWFSAGTVPCDPVPPPRDHPYRLILLGPPGVGKGTQAVQLGKLLRACHLSTGDLFRQAQGQCSLSPVMQQAVAAVQRGELVAEELVIGMVRERSGCLQCHGGFLLDGFPRSVSQAEALDALLTDLGVVLDGAIDKLVAFARAHPDAGIWGGRTQFADGRLNPTSVWGKITPWSAVSFASGLRGLLRRFEAFNPEGLGAWQRDSERRVDIVSGCFLMIERAFWNRLGGFDRRFFMYGEEADLCARARAAGARPLMTPSACIIHYGGASATSHASKIAYVMGARIGLIERQYAGLGRVVGKSASLAHVAVRAFSFRLLGALFPARYAAKAREWGSAWARRAEWRNGPSAVEL